MVPKHSVLRVARPTDQLSEVVRMYVEGLGFEVLGRFHDHDGFDGVIMGHGNHAYHLEFTYHRGTTVGKAPTADHLLVFYVPDLESFRNCKAALAAAGFREVVSYNPYWDVAGVTFEDIDGYRIVIQNSEWRA